MPESTSSLSLSPWREMWIRPGDTVSHLVENQPDQQVVLLAALAGTSNSLLSAWVQSGGDEFSLGFLIVNALAMGSIWGIGVLYVHGFLIGWTGKLLGGKGEGRDIRTALAWGALPFVAALAVWAVAIPVFGSSLFTTASASTTGESWIFRGSSMAAAALFVYSFALTAHALGRVQGFSAWKALLNLGLAGILWITPFAVISGISRLF